MSAPRIGTSSPKMTQIEMGRKCLYDLYKAKAPSVKTCVQTFFKNIFEQQTQFKRNHLAYDFEEHRFVVVYEGLGLKPFCELSTKEISKIFNDYEVVQIKNLAVAILMKTTKAPIRVVTQQATTSKPVNRFADPEKYSSEIEGYFTKIYEENAKKEQEESIPSEKVQALTAYLLSKIRLAADQCLMMRQIAEEKGLPYASRLNAFPHLSPRIVKLLTKILEGKFLSNEEKVLKRKKEGEYLEQKVELSENGENPIELTEEEQIKNERLKKEAEEAEKRIAEKIKEVKAELEAFAVTGSPNGTPSQQRQHLGVTEAHTADEVPFQTEPSESVQYLKAVDATCSGEAPLDKELPVPKTDSDATVEVVVLDEPEITEKPKPLEVSIKINQKMSSCLRFWNWLKNLPSSIGGFFKRLFLNLR